MSIGGQLTRNERSDQRKSRARAITLVNEVGLSVQHQTQLLEQTTKKWS